MTRIDLIVLAILGLMLMRGFWIGLVRELASLGAIALALIGIRLFAGPAGGWLAERSGSQPSSESEVADALANADIVRDLETQGDNLEKLLDQS